MQNKSRTLVKFIRIAISVIVLSVLIYMAYRAYPKVGTEDDIGTFWFFIILIFTLLATWIIEYLFRPNGIIVIDDTLILNRMAKPVKIYRDEIQEIVPIQKNDIEKSVKLMGFSGWSHRWGRFRNKNIGLYTMYANDLKDLALIKTTSKKYVINCTPEAMEDLSQWLSKERRRSL